MKDPELSLLLFVILAYPISPFPISTDVQAVVIVQVRSASPEQSSTEVNLLTFKLN